MKAKFQQSGPFFHFRNDLKPLRYTSIFMAFCMLHLSVGCNYYKVNEVPLSRDNIAGTIQEFNQERNYAVINETWQLENLKVNADEQSISGVVQTAGAQHLSKKERELGKTYRYKKAQRQPFNELHFKVNSGISFTPGQELTIDFTDIQSVSVNDKNTGRTVIAFIASTVGIFFATILIIAALKSSCPFVYIKNGEEFVFKGELYPGIITPKLQRPDYLPLPGFEPGEEKYTLKVTNELREIQHTDVLQLWVAQHTAAVKLAIDQQGQLHSFCQLQPVVRMSNSSGVVSETALQQTDDLFYTFNNEAATTESTRELILEFDKPKKASSAKLLLTAKNSLWLDYVFGKFNEQFGSYYTTFQQQQQEVPAKKAEAWIKNQHIPLSVYLKTRNGWELVDQINTVGPMAVRELAIPLRMDQVAGERVAVKLQCGFMFWELDYAGIDYTPDEEFELVKIAPDKAIDETGKAVTALLSQTDGNYLVQPEIGNEVTVQFNVPPLKEGMSQSVFLLNKGYYNYVRDYDGIPNFKKLKTFREDFAFTRYSENMYRAIMNYEAPLDLATNE